MLLDAAQMQVEYVHYHQEQHRLNEMAIHSRIRRSSSVVCVTYRPIETAQIFFWIFFEGVCRDPVMAPSSSRQDGQWMVYMIAASQILPGRRLYIEQPSQQARRQEQLSKVYTGIG